MSPFLIISYLLDYKLAEKQFFSLGGLLTAVFMSNELGIRSNNWIWVLFFVSLRQMKNFFFSLLPIPPTQIHKNTQIC